MINFILGVFVGMLTAIVFIVMIAVSYEPKKKTKRSSKSKKN